MHARANDGFAKSSKTRPLRAGPYRRYIISNSLRVKIVGPRYPIVSIYIPLLMFIKRTLRLRGAQALGSEKL